MKDIILQAGETAAHVNAFGAELKGLSLNGIEYLYDGDPLYYARTSPTLFPIIGRFLSDTYYVGSKAYHMGINGFALERNFTVEHVNDHTCVFLLSADERTQAMYPFSFHFWVSYALSEGRMDVTYTVENCGTNKMPFSVGCHTAYRWPLLEGETAKEYELRFEKNEQLRSFNPFNWKDADFVKGKNRPLSHELFSNYTRSMTEIQSAWIEFGSRAGDHAVRIQREEMPYLAMWTLPNENARFVCLEPCTSVHAGAAATLEERNGIIILDAGTTVKKHFAIELR
ncbi:MAG: hypothetical protein PHI98_15930 [Eubacteriales bacterium]|nr:hypothetical protein [Eubacteriales bacterium]